MRRSDIEQTLTGLIATPTPEALDLSRDEFTATVIDAYACSLWGSCEAAASAPPGHKVDGSPVWWTGRNVPLADAVVANLSSVTTHDLDAVNYPAGGHTAAFLVPLVEAHTNIDDTSRRRAYVAGLEASIRFGSAFSYALQSAGHHPTPLVGGVATIVAETFMRDIGRSVAELAVYLYLSTFRSSYALLATPGRMFQNRAAVRSAFACIAEAESWDQALQVNWWSPLDWLDPGDLWRYGTRDEPWMFVGATSHIKTAPICSHFASTLGFVAEIVASRADRETCSIEISVPKGVAAAITDEVSGEWIQPFNLAHNAALTWLHRSAGWGPERDIDASDITEATKKIRIVVNDSEADPEPGYEICLAIFADEGATYTYRKRVRGHGVTSQVGEARAKLTRALAASALGGLEEAVDALSRSDDELIRSLRSASSQSRPIDGSTAA
jgi:hypothetical protein